MRLTDMRGENLSLIRRPFFWMLSPHAPRASNVTSFPARKKFRARLQPSTPAPNTKIFIAKSPLILKIPVSFVLPRLAMLSFRFSFVLRQLVISNRNTATDGAKVKMSFYRSPVLPCPFSSSPSLDQQIPASKGAAHCSSVLACFCHFARFVQKISAFANLILLLPDIFI